MGRKPQLLDRWGNPVKRAGLTQEVAAATTVGVRSPVSGYPADGLTPVRLAAILRAADMGDPVQYLELAETIEERNPHFLGVLGTRRRSVSQLDIRVEAASDDARDAAIAKMVEDWLQRDELTDELFDILDAIGKGYSFTEIIWDTSAGQWMPLRLERRDPRWFRFDRVDLTTPVQLDDHGAETPLEPYKFIFARMSAKSGLPIRGGLARTAAWNWMFKAFTERDWAIFTQTYGQPLRVGKFGAGASEDDKDTLFRAVANIAGDCAAIIPESMAIDFVEAGNLNAGTDLYLKRADWLDQQMSKAVLGQTATTDSITGGLGSGKEHRQVQEDIEEADAKALAAIVNRDLIRPWVDLEFGPQLRYPRIRIARAEAEDLKLAADILGVLVPLGLRVSTAEVRERFGWDAPAADAEILALPTVATPQGAPAAPPRYGNGDQRAVKYPFNTRPALQATATPETDTSRSTGQKTGVDPVSAQSPRLEVEARPAMRAMMDRIEAMLAAAGSLDEFHEMLLAGSDSLDDSAFAETMALAMASAELAGRAEVQAEDDE